MTRIKPGPFLDGAQQFCAPSRHVRSARACLFLLTLSFISPGLAAGQDSLPLHRAEHLRHGINLSEWFAQVYDSKGYTKEHFDTWNTSQDIALIEDMGFDHVRLSINPKPMFLRNQADRIPADYIASLDRAVQMILAQKLAVILDIHPDSDFKDRLAHEDSYVEQFADFWRALARHYSNLDPNLVFFEVLNEPEVRDPYRWYGIQARLASAIREGAPDHTIILAGARWSDDDDLVFIEPIRDPNVIYNFHFYEPHIFTHQGATWGESYWHYLHDLPYPSNPDKVKVAEALEPDAIHKLAVARYGADHWDKSRIDADIAQVAAWGKKWNVPLTCNEFGVYRKYANPQDRAAWISDVRTTLEKYGIGWTMWDFSGGFAVVVKKDGQMLPDDVTIKALGMKFPRPVM
jgi:endoglucanase